MTSESVTETDCNPNKTTEEQHSKTFFVQKLCKLPWWTFFTKKIAFTDFVTVEAFLCYAVNKA